MKWEFEKSIAAELPSNEEDEVYHTLLLRHFEGKLVLRMTK